MQVWRRWVLTVLSQVDAIDEAEIALDLVRAATTTRDCSHRPKEAFYLAPSFRSTRSTPNTGTTIMKMVHMALAKRPMS